MLKVAAYFCKLISEQNKFLGEKEKTMISREKGQSFFMIYLGLHNLIYLHFHGHNTKKK